MKALLFILILVPFLVIGCAQATQVSPEPPAAPAALPEGVAPETSPEPPTAPDAPAASPEEVAPEGSPTVDARTLVIEPAGEGSYAVGSSYFMLSEDALEYPGKANDPRYLSGSGGNAGEELIYIDDILKDTPAIHFEVKVPDDQKVYGNTAGTIIPYSGFLLYPITEENPYSFQPPQTDLSVGFPHCETYMQGKDEAPVFAEADKRYPLIVHSPGLGGSPAGGNFPEIKWLASHGYAVLAIFPGDGRFPNYETSPTPQEITLRPLSIKASLDYLEDHPDYKEHVDFGKIGGWGGSYGGTTMFAIMGGKIIDKSSSMGGTLDKTVADTRIKAAVGIVPYMGDNNFPTVMGQKSSIFGWRHSGVKDVNGPYLAIAGATDTRAVYDYTKEVLETAKEEMYLIKCEGEGHELSKGAYQDARTWALTFLNAYVDGNKSELDKFQQMLSVEGGAGDVFVEIE